MNDWKKIPLRSLKEQGEDRVRIKQKKKKSARVPPDMGRRLSFLGLKSPVRLDRGLIGNAKRKPTPAGALSHGVVCEEVRKREAGGAGGGAQCVSN